jgi:serine kinase of HPr protein (carbohydrate metabolism regulator)
MAGGDTGGHSRVIVHGTTIAVAGRAALLRGPSGSGKSDLALRVVALPPLAPSGAGAELVADDRTCVARMGDDLHVTAPETIAGAIEVRGVGIVRLPACPTARLALVVDLVPAGTAVDRMPEALSASWFGVTVPRIVLHPFEASAAVKVVLALRHDGGDSLG